MRRKETCEEEEVAECWRLLWGREQKRNIFSGKID